MIELEYPLRRATRDDAAALADFINIAGEGLPMHVWQQMADEGEDPWMIGRRSQAEKAEDDKVVVVDEGAGPVAMLMGYPISDIPEVIEDDELAQIRPLIELENLAPLTWYVNVLAAYPEARNRGYGTQLLALSERLAAEHGLSAVSVIVANQNVGARRLYERCGFTETARLPIVKDGWECDSNEWLLLVKQL
jgi:ribosomal protein S18 acetylase RimI-like enzyme